MKTPWASLLWDITIQNPWKELRSSSSSPSLKTKDVLRLGDAKKPGDVSLPKPLVMYICAAYSQRPQGMDMPEGSHETHPHASVTFLESTQSPNPLHCFAPNPLHTAATHFVPLSHAAFTDTTLPWLAFEDAKGNSIEAFTQPQLQSPTSTASLLPQGLLTCHWRELGQFDMCYVW